jgi:dipeptidyl aminopeptidase/acylaminoacyl peptidase
VIARSGGERCNAKELSRPEGLRWKVADGAEAYGLFYPPASATHAGIGKPPLLVQIHGGPTSQTRAGYSSGAQFYATRGYAVLVVNHRGSTGYGRAFMLAHAGTWGRVDVDDAVAGVKHLVQSGRVDGERVVITGGSAGGYTVLQAMIDAPDVFAAGIASYGIANQFTLVATTHKFELHYSDWLLGPLPEAAALYRERSPVFHAAKIKRPLAVFQGDQDKVVPKEQSDTIVKALQRSGAPHIYHVYAGEGHGWRKPETIQHYHETVEAFLRNYVLYP